MDPVRIAAAAAVAFALASSACTRPPSAPAGGQAFPPAAVKVEAARIGQIEDATEYVATLKSLRSTAIQPQIDGQITQIFVKSGDHVAEGAPLAQIDPRRQQAAVSSQEGELAARQADVGFARQQYQRATDLFAAGAISKQEVEQAQTALQTAEAHLRGLGAQVQEQQVQLRYYTVSAPTAGIIGDVPARVGNQVTTQTVLTTIDQNATLEVQVQVPIERASDLRNGLPLLILSSDGSEKVAATTVNFVSPRVDGETQSVLVKGTVPNPDGVMRPSQYVRARIVWKTVEGLVIPVTAVLRISGQFFAFVAEESKGGQPGADPSGRGSTPGTVARQKPIVVGQIAGDSYVVRSGLKPGDRVVVSGVQRLADGAPIAPQE
jgi:RND family efflux transporter MFP subunit